MNTIRTIASIATCVLSVGANAGGMLLSDSAYIEYLSSTSLVPPNPHYSWSYDGDTHTASMTAFASAGNSPEIVVPGQYHVTPSIKVDYWFKDEFPIIHFEKYFLISADHEAHTILGRSTVVADITTPYAPDIGTLHPFTYYPNWAQASIAHGQYNLEENQFFSNASRAKIIARTTEPINWPSASVTRTPKPWLAPRYSETNLWNLYPWQNHLANEETLTKFTASELTLSTIPGDPSEHNGYTHVASAIIAGEDLKVGAHAPDGALYFFNQGQIYASANDTYQFKFIRTTNWITVFNDLKTWLPRLLAVLRRTDGTIVTMTCVNNGAGGYTIPVVDMSSTFELYVLPPKGLITFVGNFSATGDPVTVSFDARIGDIDSDGYIGTDDYLLMSQFMDTSIEDASFLDEDEQGFCGLSCDLNCDDSVNTDDYLILSDSFDQVADELQ